MLPIPFDSINIWVPWLIACFASFLALAFLPLLRYVIVVEHDLSVLDYLSDFICCLYGVPSAYGVVTMPFSVREGINIFLAGRVPTENLRFREEELTFKFAEVQQEVDVKRHHSNSYPAMTKTMGDFILRVEAGEFSESEIIVLLGENGTGKTTFIRMLAGVLPGDEGVEIPELNVSYKPQKIAPKFEGTVRQLLFKKVRDAFMHPQFQTDVFKPLKIDDIIDQEVTVLSGGELQRVALVLCLGQPADIYLIDEPSAYLDSEQRLIASKVIKRFVASFLLSFFLDSWPVALCFSHHLSLEIHAVSSCIPRRLPSLSNTISSWQLIWPIV